MQVTAVDRLLQALSEFGRSVESSAVEVSSEGLIQRLVQQYDGTYPITPIILEPKPSRIVNGQSLHSDELRNALTIDPSGAIFIALRLPNLKEELQEINLPLNNVLVDMAALGEILQKYMHLQVLVKQASIYPAYLQFLQSMTDLHNAASRMKPELSSRLTINDLVEGYPSRLSELNKLLGRYKSLELWSVDDVEPSGIPEQVNEWIVRVPNDEVLLESSKYAPLGFTVFATINEDDVASSYFSLLCRSVDKVVLYQDVLVVEYPGQHTRRRNDRVHANRINNSPFPYELLDLVVSDKERNIQASKDSRALTRTEDSLMQVLAAVRDVEDGTLIDLLTCIRLIAADWNTLNLKKMASPAQALLSFLPETECVQLPALVQKKAIHLPWEKMTTHKLTSEVYRDFEISHGNRKPEPNWVAEQIIPEILSVMPEEHLIQKNGSENGLFPATVGVPALLSTEQQVKSDLWYLARVNQLEKMTPYIQSWQKQALVEACQFLKERMATSYLFFNYLVQEHLWGCDSWRYTGSNSNSVRLKIPEDMEVFLMQNCSNTFGSFGNGTVADLRTLSWFSTSTWLTKNDQYLGRLVSEQTVILNSPGPNHARPLKDMPCFMDPSERAELFYEIEIDGCIAMALFCDVPLLELPVKLRTLGLRPYLGNSILSRTDPLLHSDLWKSNESFVVVIGLSMKSFNQLRLSAGMTKMTKAAVERQFDAIRRSSS